jgi:hypothetical protein
VARTIPSIIERALEGYAALATVGEAVDEEWQYVTDLTTAWRARLSAIAAASDGAPAPPGSDRAVDLALDEIRLITDPHRAIDWLSTFPQVVLLALGEEDRPAAVAPTG